MFKSRKSVCSPPCIKIISFTVLMTVKDLNQAPSTVSGPYNSGSYGRIFLQHFHTSNLSNVSRRTAPWFHGFPTACVLGHHFPVLAAQVGTIAIKFLFVVGHGQKRHLLSPSGHRQNSNSKCRL